MKKINVALYGASLSGWGGGVDFMRHIANSLAMQSDKNLKIFLLIPYTYTTISYIKLIIKYLATLNFKIPSIKSLNQSPYQNSLKLFNKKIQIIHYQENELNKTLQKINADILLPLGPSRALPALSIPYVGYIFDFQHKYFPDFFSQQEQESRDKSFSDLLSRAPAVIVNSRDTQTDIKKFFPTTKSSIFPLPFIVPPLPQSFLEQPSISIEKFQLPKKFFIICNQFWQHKDHLTAFKALALLEKKFQDIHIVCTGKTEDYRNKEYFPQLQLIIEKFGLKNRIHFLGYIKKEEQLVIMNKAIALLNPTLFEGGPGGGATQEALALGLPVIISDIAVNLEINQPGILYFKKQSEKHLADKMKNLLENRSIPSNHKKNSNNQSMASFRAQGETLMQAISYVLQKHKDLIEQ